MKNKNTEFWIDMLKILGLIIFYSSLFFIILHFIFKYW